MVGQVVGWNTQLASDELLLLPGSSEVDAYSTNRLIASIWPYMPLYFSYKFHTIVYTPRSYATQPTYPSVVFSLSFALADLLTIHSRINVLLILVDFINSISLCSNRDVGEITSITKF